MTSLETLLLVLGGFAAGAVNAVAGGGTFFTFAALVFAGLPTLDANATSAVALTPANFAGVAGYHDEVRRHARELMPIMAISLAGAALGAWLLIAIGDDGFRPTVPWLLLFATLLFAGAPSLNRLLAPVTGMGGGRVPRLAAYALITLVAIYSGFFGAGAGIMMLAALAIVEGGDFHKSNAIKNVVAFLAQVVSSALLVAGSLVHWRAALIVMAASVAGAFLGVLAARRVPVNIIRGVVVTSGAALTVVFLLR